MTSWRAVSRRRVLTTVLGSSALAVTACGVPEALKKPPGLSASVRTLRASITAEQARWTVTTTWSAAFLNCPGG